MYDLKYLISLSNICISYVSSSVYTHVITLFFFFLLKYVVSLLIGEINELNLNCVGRVQLLIQRSKIFLT